MLQNWLENGIIKPSTSEYRAPILIVPKKEGKFRLCVDYRALNKVTRPNNYQLPRIDHIKATIRGKIFSTLDLKDGFFQVPVDEETVPLTGMATPEGTFVFVRMSFGLRNAPPYFQRLMDDVCRDLPNCMAYIDDVAVYSENLSDHFKHLEAFFARAQSYGLTINFDKTQMFQTRVTYLGFEFDHMGYRPKPEVLPKVSRFYDTN